MNSRRRVTGVLFAVLLMAFTQVVAQVVRTGDVTVRGLKEGDFPRVKKLAENVYAYERIYPSMGGNFSGHPSEWIDVIKSRAETDCRVLPPRRHTEAQRGRGIVALHGRV